MDRNKHIQIEVFDHRNIYADVFIPIMRRPGFNTGVKTTYSVICSKQIGVSTSGNDELEKLSLMTKKFKSHSISYMISHSKLSFKPPNSTIQNIKNNFESYEPNKNLIRNIIDKIFADKTILEFECNDLKTSIIKDALVNTLSDFEISETSLNSSKMINICVKLIYWINFYLKDVIRKTITALDKNTINPKIIHLGDLSHQESYYMLLSYFLGFDVIYMSFDHKNINNFSKKLDDICKINKLNLSASDESLIIFARDEMNIETASKTPKLTPKVTPQVRRPVDITRPSANKVDFSRPSAKSKVQTNANVGSSTSNSKLIKKDINSNIIINHKKFDGDLKEILAPPKDRAGYIGMPSPVIPAYFVRYIGVDSDKSVYRNRLFNFDQVLSSEYRNYIMFNSSIKLGNYTELNKKTSLIWQEFKSINTELIDDLIKYLNGSFALSFIHDEGVRNRCYIALKDVLKIAFHGSNDIPTSKVKNLVIKLIGWLSDHSNDLIGSYSFDKKHNPKVVFYGDIKSHEALYLIFLHYCGVDVVYINSFQDDIFEALDPDLNISSVYTLDKVHPYEDFPTSEVMVLQQTTAYEASEEIARIIHNDQDGVYKPWQFEKYNTMPLTLRTTYDEVFILWDEHARIRTGFKVEKNTIYIPNMFVKISATQEDISEYWKIVNQVSSSKLTQFYTKLPFTDTDFSKQNLSYVDTIFENHSTLSFDKLQKHDLYKYSHLSNELQSLIYNKLCMLLDTDILNKNAIDDLRLKITLTVLNLNDDLLKLIQNFDFPAHIPKLVIYDSDETTFSQSDAITMAFLYAMGFDICVLTPTGYNNFEMFIDDKYYSIFKLPNKQFNLELPDLKRYSNSKGKSFWASIFG